MAIILHTAWQFCLRLNAYGIDLERDWNQLVLNL